MSGAVEGDVMEWSATFSDHLPPHETPVLFTYESGPSFLFPSFLSEQVLGVAMDGMFLNVDRARKEDLGRHR